MTREFNQKTFITSFEKHKQLLKDIIAPPIDPNDARGPKGAQGGDGVVGTSSKVYFSNSGKNSFKLLKENYFKNNTALEKDVIKRWGNEIEMFKQWCKQYGNKKASVKIIDTILKNTTQSEIVRTKKNNKILLSGIQEMEKMLKIEDYVESYLIARNIADNLYNPDTGMPEMDENVLKELNKILSK